MRPKAASIIIVNWNGRHLLEQFLPSVLDATRNGDEVIIVDNGSTDGSVEFLKSQFPQVRLLPLPRNYGFSIAHNLGALMAKNEIIVLLNNDMKPESCFLDPMLENFDDPNVFAVGAKLLRFDGSPDFANRNRLVVSGGLLSVVCERDEDKLKLVKEPEEQFHAPGGGAAFDQRKFLALGGFDPIFSPAYFEDVDLSLKAIQKGWRILYEPRSVIWHLGSQTGKVKPRWFFELLAYRNFWLYNFLNAPNFTWAGWQVGSLLRWLVSEAIAGRFLTCHISALLLLTKLWGIVKRRCIKPPMTAEQLAKLLVPFLEESQEANGQADSLPNQPFVLLLAPAYEGDKLSLQMVANAARQQWKLPIAIIARSSQTMHLKRDGIADIVIPFLKGSPYTPVRSFPQLVLWLAKSPCQAFAVPSQVRSPSKGKFILLGIVVSLWSRKPLWEWNGERWRRFSALGIIERLLFLPIVLPFYFLLTIVLLSSALISDFVRLTFKAPKATPRQRGNALS